MRRGSWAALAVLMCMAGSTIQPAAAQPVIEPLAIPARPTVMTIPGTIGEVSTEIAGARGVYGESPSPDGAGVYGRNTADEGSGAGVVGESDSSTGAGVAGYADHPSGRNFGVYGHSSSPAGYGLYSHGNAHVDGDLSWKSRRGYVSLPAAAFRPSIHVDKGDDWTPRPPYDTFSRKIEDLDDHVNTGAGLTSLDPWARLKRFVAPVHLPHGARVVGFGYSYFDGSPNETTAQLLRSDTLGVVEVIAEVDSPVDGAPGIEYQEASTISHATVDNRTRTYFATVFLSDPKMSAYGVFVAYEYDRPH